MTAGLILKRAKVSRPSGQWRDDDFNVLEDDGPELLARLAGLPFRLCISNRTHAFDIEKRQLPPKMAPLRVAAGPSQRGVQGTIHPRTGT
jgi:hypothetical protein